MKKLSFVIPCYGSELTIEGVVREIEETVSLLPDFDHEIICVNDCSPDGVWEVLRNLAALHPQLTAVDLTRNMGKHSAVMAGYSLVSGDVVVNLDDDGQCPVPELPRLLAKLDEGCDIAMARYTNKNEAAVKMFGSRVNALMSRFLLGRPKELAIENFSAVRRIIVDEVARYRNPYPNLEGLFLRSTSRIANVDMRQRERAAGQGNFTFLKSLKLWLDGFTAFSVRPLRVSTVAGMVLAFAGFLFALLLVIRKLFFEPDMALGYPSLMAVILFIGGMLMMMLGLLGEYVGRIYISLNNSPQYVIRSVVRGPGPDGP